jgi:hypothetical protein
MHLDEPGLALAGMGQGSPLESADSHTAVGNVSNDRVVQAWYDFRAGRSVQNRINYVAPKVAAIFLDQTQAANPDRLGRDGTMPG